MWFITGLWHGADNQFVVWGLWLGFWIVVEKVWLLKFAAKTRVMHLYTMFVIFVSWSIFNAPSLSIWWERYVTLPWISSVALETLLVRNSIVLFVVCIVMSGPWIRKWFYALPSFVRQITFTIIFILSVASLIHGSLNPFLYFRF